MFERLRNDITYLRGALRTLRRTAPIVRNPTRIFPAVIDELAERHGDKPALLSIARPSATAARGTLAPLFPLGAGAGLAKATWWPSDAERPEYFAIWLG